jgi:hypothetical protein
VGGRSSQSPRHSTFAHHGRFLRLIEYADAKSEPEVSPIVPASTIATFVPALLGARLHPNGRCARLTGLDGAAKDTNTTCWPKGQHVCVDYS